MKMKYLSAMDAEFALTQFQNKGWANWSKNDLNGHFPLRTRETPFGQQYCFERVQ